MISHIPHAIRQPIPRYRKSMATPMRKGMDMYIILFPNLHLTRAHTVFAGRNAVWHCAAHRQAPACHLRRTSPYSISATQNSAGLFDEGKSDDDKEESRRNTCVFQGSMTQSALICTVEKRVCPCQAKVCFTHGVFVIFPALIRRPHIVTGQVIGCFSAGSIKPDAE